MSQFTHEFILASESPRRKQLLVESGFSITVFPIKVSEKIEKNLNIDEQILAIARQKSKAAVNQIKLLKTNNYLILTADTMVVLDQEALGKPKNEAAAEEMLSRLSGREHQVKTAICFYDSHSKKCVTALDTTTVKFRLISRQEILDYISTGEPMDKAGSYAIQGLGGHFVEKYVGDYNNVVGLPIHLVKKLLQEFGWKV